MTNPPFLSRFAVILLIGVFFEVHSFAAAPAFQWSTLAGRASAGNDDGPASQARFDAPRGVALDAAGNLYVADKNNHTIRKITATGTVSTLAGTAGQAGSADGIGAAARFNSPEGVAADSLGNVYVSDTGNDTVRKITVAGLVTTVAGTAGVAGDADGPAAAAQFRYVRQITVDASGTVYVVDYGRVRRIANGQVATIYQSGSTVSLVDAFGNQSNGTLNVMGGIAVSATGEIYFTAMLTIYYPSNGFPYTYPVVLKRTANGEVAPVYGGPQVYLPSEKARFQWLALDGTGNIAVLGDSFDSAFWVRVRPDGSSTRSYLPALKGYATMAYGITLSATGDLYYARDDNTIFRQPTASEAVVVAGVPRTAVPFDLAWSLAVDAAGNAWVAVADYSRPDGETNFSDASVLKKVTPAGAVTTAIAPRFIYPEFKSYSSPLVAADGSRGVYFLHGRESQSTLTHLAEDGMTTDALIGLKPTGTSGYFGFYAVEFVADAAGNPVVPDSIGHAIWRRNTDGTWVVLAGKDGEAGRKDGTGGDARFDHFHGITNDRSGNFYVIDYVDWTQTTPPSSFIRKITPAGVVTTVSPDLMQPLAQDRVEPSSLAIDSKGVFYLTYPALNSVLRFEPGGELTAIGGKGGVPGVVDGVGDAARFMAPALVAVDAQDRLLIVDGRAGVMRRGIALAAPAISTQPQSVSVAAGGSVQFSVTANGSPDPTYQWNFNGVAISGATANSYSIGSAQAANAGNYTVTVTNSQGSATSSTATLTVTTGGGGGSGGGGGGGAPGVWFYAALVLATVVRFRTRFFAN